MHRRRILWGAFSALGAVVASATTRASAATDARPQDRLQGKLKVVYHLNDLDKVNFVIGNIENHFDGVGGPDNVTIALVVQARRCGHFTQARPTRISAGASVNFPG